MGVPSMGQAEEPERSGEMEVLCRRWSSSGSAGTFCLAAGIPVLNLRWLWQQSQNQMQCEEGSGLLAAATPQKYQVGRRGLPRDTSGTLQPQWAAVATGLAGRSEKERSGATAPGVRMLGGIWDWATEHISEMFLVILVKKQQTRKRQHI